MVVELSPFNRFFRVKSAVRWRIGQIPTFFFHHVFETPRLDHNFIVYPLEIGISEGRGCNSVLPDSYGRLADFVV